MNNSCHLQILDILQESPDLIEIYLKYVIDNKIIHTSSCNFTCYPMHLSKNITDYLVMYIAGLLAWEKIFRMILNDGGHILHQKNI